MSKHIRKEDFYNFPNILTYIRILCVPAFIAVFFAVSGERNLNVYVAFSIFLFASATDIVDGYIFNLGHGGQAAGEYILTSLLAKQAAREAGEPLPGVAPLASESAAAGGEADEHVA